jgi:hypothetical protein
VRKALLFVLLPLFAGLARAQEQASDAPPERPPEFVSKEQQLVLAERERERMHPGDALDLVGIDEGAPEFRAKTPSLERNSAAPAFVDLDALREQRLAMYETGAVSTRPLARLTDGDPRRVDDESTPPPAAIVPAEPTESPWYTNKLVWLGAAAVGVVVALLRRRA